MSTGISFRNEDDLSKKIKTIMSQTNYNEDEVKEKLQLFDNDYMKVIRDYMGISDKKTTKVSSVNQEIFRQIRTNLDISMKEYREKNPINMEQLIDNFNEADELQNKKN